MSRSMTINECVEQILKECGAIKSKLLILPYYKWILRTIKNCTDEFGQNIDINVEIYV